MTPIQVYMPAGEAREGKLRAAIEADKQGRFAWGGHSSDLPGDVRFEFQPPCEITPVCCTGTTIELTTGGAAMIDEEDFPMLASFHWSLHSDGYAVASRGRNLMHRMILNAPTGMDVDHINRNRLDNRKVNLRLVSRSENMRNAGPHADNKSGYRGVSWFARDSKWKAQISIAGKNRHIGYFKTKEEAALAYNRAAKENFGNVAMLNNVKKYLDVEIKDFTGEGNSDYLASILNGHLWDQVTRATGPYVIAVLGDDADISSAIRKAAGHGKKGKHGSFDLDKFAAYANMLDGFEANCLGRGIQVWHLGYNQFPRLLLRARKILEGGDLSGFAPHPAPGERKAVALSILAGDGIGATKAKSILNKFDLCLVVKDGCLAELEDCSGIGPKLASRIRENIEVVD